VKLASFDLINGIKDIYGGETDSLTLNTVIKLQQQGKDNGIQRSFTALRDSLDRIPFLIGKKYYYGVSAYTFRHDPDGILTNSESPMKVISVVFQDSLPGLKYMDTLKVIRISGQSDKMVTAVVYDPSKLTGHDYEIGFENAPGTISCYVKDLTLNTYLTHDINQVESVDSALGGPVIDGVVIGVHDAIPGMKDYLIPSGTRKWTWVNANSFNMEGFNGAIGSAYKNWYSASSVPPQKLTNTLIRFASTDSLGNLLDPNDPNVSYAYRYLRFAQNPPARPEFQQYIKNASENYAFQDYAKSLPFAAYNEIGQRLMVGFLENNVAGGRVDGKYWPPASDEGIDNYSTTGPREWFFIFNIPYSATPSSELQKSIMNNTVPMLWFGTPNRTGASNTAFDKNDQFLIIKNNIFTTEDKFNFTTNNITSVKPENIPFKFELAQNYPNPFNPKTQILFSLAERGMVKLRVYNVLGQMVKELVNGELNAGIHKLEFSGNNLASGIYIYRLDIKDKFTDVKKMLLLK
jgi:hypothetical protein